MKKLTLIGVTVVIVGIAAIALSRTVKFTRQQIPIQQNYQTKNQAVIVEDVQTKNIVLFCGIALAIAGSGCIALSASGIVDVN